MGHWPDRLLAPIFNIIHIVQLFCFRKGRETVLKTLVPDIISMLAQSPKPSTLDGHEERKRNELGAYPEARRQDPRQPAEPGCAAARFNRGSRQVDRGPRAAAAPGLSPRPRPRLQQVFGAPALTGEHDPGGQLRRPLPGTRSRATGMPSSTSSSCSFWLAWPRIGRAGASS